MYKLYLGYVLNLVVTFPSDPSARVDDHPRHFGLSVHLHSLSYNVSCHKTLNENVQRIG